MDGYIFCKSLSFLDHTSSSFLYGTLQSKNAFLLIMSVIPWALPCEVAGADINPASQRVTQGSERVGLCQGHPVSKEQRGTTPQPPHYLNNCFRSLTWDLDISWVWSRLHSRCPSLDLAHAWAWDVFTCMNVWWRCLGEANFGHLGRRLWLSPACRTLYFCWPQGAPAQRMTREICRKTSAYTTVWGGMGCTGLILQ